MRKETQGARRMAPLSGAESGSGGHLGWGCRLCEMTPRVRFPPGEVISFAHGHLWSCLQKQFISMGLVALTCRVAANHNVGRASGKFIERVSQYLNALLQLPRIASVRC